MDNHDSTTPNPAGDGNEFPKQSHTRYGSIRISGHAKVQLGDYYETNRDVFEIGTPEQRRTGRYSRNLLNEFRTQG